MAPVVVVKIFNIMLLTRDPQPGCRSGDLTRLYHPSSLGAQRSQPVSECLETASRHCRRIWGRFPMTLLRHRWNSPTELPHRCMDVAAAASSELQRLPSSVPYPWAVHMAICRTFHRQGKVDHARLWVVGVSRGKQGDAWSFGRHERGILWQAFSLCRCSQAC
jgi:hypothetical protein